MSMNIGSEKDDEIMSEINTTPLVDVMLVLLIIFLITIPVVTTSIKVDLPKEKNLVRETKPETVIISVDVKGKIFLYDTPIKNSDDLLQRMKKFAVMKPQPEVREVDMIGPMLTFKNKRGGHWLYPNAKAQIIADCPYGRPGDRLGGKHDLLGAVGLAVLGGDAVGVGHRDQRLVTRCGSKRWTVYA